MENFQKYSRKYRWDNDLEKRIEKLEEGFRKIELKIEKESQGEFYNLMGRVREVNKSRGKRRLLNLYEDSSRQVDEAWIEE